MCNIIENIFGLKQSHDELIQEHGVREPYEDINSKDRTKRLQTRIGKWFIICLVASAIVFNLLNCCG